jgi:hypothetical protein
MFFSKVIYRHCLFASSFHPWNDTHGLNFTPYLEKRFPQNHAERSCGMFVSWRFPTHSQISFPEISNRLRHLQVRNGYQWKRKNHIKKWFSKSEVSREVDRETVLDSSVQNVSIIADPPLDCRRQSATAEARAARDFAPRRANRGDFPVRTDTGSSAPRTPPTLNVTTLQVLLKNLFQTFLSCRITKQRAQAKPHEPNFT